MALFGANTGRTLTKGGGRLIGAAAGTLIGQPQLGYTLGGMVGDAVAPDPAERMKSFSSYQAPNPFDSYRQEDFDKEVRSERKVELSDPISKVLPLVDTAVSVAGGMGAFDKLGEAGSSLFGNVKSMFGDKGSGNRFFDVTGYGDDLEDDLLENDLSIDETYSKLTKELDKYKPR